MPWDEVMHKWKAGTLRSGGSGSIVRNKKQAIAIEISEKKQAEQGNREYQSKKVGPLRRAAGRK